MEPIRHTGHVLALNAAVLLAAAVFFAWINAEGVGSRSLPGSEVSGQAASLHRVGRQRDVYALYVQAGLRGASVVHLNRFFNMRYYAPTDQFFTTEFPLLIRDMRSVYEPGIDSHTWLFIATRTGMVRTVTTVLPDHIFRELSEKNRDDRVFTHAKGVITGYTYDIPRAITTAASLAAIDEPVIVNVDAGYFSSDADPAGTAALLKDRCRNLRMLVLIESVDEPGVTDAMREHLTVFESAWRTGR